MSASCKSLSPQVMDGNKPGIISILGLSGDLGQSADNTVNMDPSLRRTLSADMCKKKFPTLQFSSSCMKKVVSSEDMSSSISPKNEREGGQNRASQTDIWNMIQARNSNDGAASGASYVPAIRRSSSSLSAKSLELCTESLGSETGSECTTVERSPPPWLSLPPPPPPSTNSSSSPPCLSPYSSSEESSEKDFVSHIKAAKRERLLISLQAKSVNYNCATSRKSPARSFPPPLPSISSVDGPCLHVKPHRRDGRLVLQAVEVPSHSYLHAQREGGRLRLSFASTPQRRKYQNDGESEVKVDCMSWAAAESDTEGTIYDDKEGNTDAFIDGDSKEIGHEFEEDEEEEHAGKNELKVLEVFDRTVDPNVVSIERWGRSTVPAMVKLHRSLGKIISQPFMNMDPWTTGPHKKVAVVECRAGGGAGGGDHENERSVTQRFNVYKCLWRGGVGGDGRLVEGKAAVSSAVGSQDPVVKEVAISGLSPTRCSDPRRIHHHLLILERFCVATT